MSELTPPFRVWRFARKELREILRDRRTIITLVFMPVLLYPILSIAFNQYLLAVAPVEQDYRLGFPTEEEGREFERVMKVVAPGEVETEFPFKAFVSDDLEKELRDGRIDLALRLPSAAVPSRPRDGVPETVVLEIQVINDSPRGKDALAMLSKRLAQLNIRVLQRGYRRATGIQRMILPFETKVEEIQQTPGKKSSLFSTLIPLILVLMTITGAVYPSIDLTAGERERGTLEILMAAPIPRVGLLLAKYIAVLTVTMLTGLVNLTSMALTIWISGLGKVLFGEGGLTATAALGLLGLLLLMALFFSAVLLAVTSFARSFKEAQAYLIPIMLASITPGMIALLPGVQLGRFTAVTPLLNVVLLSKELFEGNVPWAETMLVVISTLLYAGGAIALAARIFGAEAVLYTEQGQIGDLFRRPRESRRSATIAAALFCVAVVFALNFLISGLTAKLPANLAIEARLSLTMLVTATLFVGMPALWSWIGRVQFRDGWQLFAPGWAAWPAAILMGLTLWPFAAEAELLIRSVGVSSLPENFRTAVTAIIDRWRDTSPVLVLTAVAIVPAIAEEIFFRGFLFNALPHREKPWRTIVATSLLFGAFHILMFNVLVVERLVPSALLGVALGWLRWRSGSVFPGMLLHVVNNGLLVLMALFPHWPPFQPIAEASGGAAHVPIVWLASALPILVTGAALAWWSGRRKLAA
jgi:ABC-2 type transport system permease protein/sodium transport system permease protein